MCVQLLHEQSHEHLMKFWLAKLDSDVGQLHNFKWSLDESCVAVFFFQSKTLRENERLGHR